MAGKVPGKTRAVKSTSRLEKIMAGGSKTTHPILQGVKKRALIKAIQKLKPEDSSYKLDQAELFSTLTIDDLKLATTEQEAKSLLKEKDIELMTHALSNGPDDSPRADQRTLGRMIILASMGDANYSPASLFTHGGRIIFDCNDSNLAKMETLMVHNETTKLVDLDSEIPNQSISFSPESTHDSNLTREQGAGITTRKGNTLLAGNQVSSHSLISPGGEVKERKHNSLTSLIWGQSTTNVGNATLFQQNLGLSTGDQSGTQGSMILVTDKTQKNFMVGIEGSSFGYGGSDITQKGHSIFGSVNSVSAFNQEKGSTLQEELPGFDDFPGKTNEGTITLTDENVKEFKLLDDWLNSQDTATKMSTLDLLMQADNAEKRHGIFNQIIDQVKGETPAGQTTL